VVWVEWVDSPEQTVKNIFLFTENEKRKRKNRNRSVLKHRVPRADRRSRCALALNRAHQASLLFDRPQSVLWAMVCKLTHTVSCFLSDKIALLHCILIVIFIVCLCVVWLIVGVKMSFKRLTKSKT